MKKRLIAFFCILSLSAGLLTGCGSSGSVEPEEGTEISDSNTSGEDQSQADSDTSQEAGTQTVAGTTAGQEKEILVVSFGTTYNDSRQKTIAAIEEDIARANPDYMVCRAFTSQTIIDKLAKRDGTVIDNLEQGFDRAVDAGVKTLLVQPTTTMAGSDYTTITAEADKYQDQFDQIVVADPLLKADADYDNVAKALIEKTKDQDNGKTAIVFMGADSSHYYEKFQDAFGKAGGDHYYVGSANRKPGCQDIIAAIKHKGYEKVYLEGFTVVSGLNTNEEMAGDGKDSWKSQFEAAGYQVETNMDGLGQIPAIRQIYQTHTKEAIAKLK